MHNGYILGVVKSCVLEGISVGNLAARFSTKGWLKLAGFYLQRNRPMTMQAHGIPMGKATFLYSRSHDSGYLHSWISETFILIIFKALLC